MMRNTPIAILLAAALLLAGCFETHKAKAPEPPKPEWTTNGTGDVTSSNVPGAIFASRTAIISGTLASGGTTTASAMPETAGHRYVRAKDEWLKLQRKIAHRVEQIGEEDPQMIELQRLSEITWREYKAAEAELGK